MSAFIPAKETLSQTSRNLNTQPYRKGNWFIMCSNHYLFYFSSILIDIVLVKYLFLAYTIIGLSASPPPEMKVKNLIELTYSPDLIIESMKTIYQLNFWNVKL